MNEIIKTCPFCGGEAIVDEMDYGVVRFCVICKDCMANSSGQYKTKQEAIAAWNTRKENG